jgi:hypothetical protein
MIYNNIQPLTSDKHRNLSVSINSYDFIADMASSPLLASEIPQAAAEYAVIFSAPNDQGDHTPLAVMGVNQGENLMLTDEGRINARYVPAFIRRYPFVFAGDDNSENLTLCIDEDSKTLDPEGNKGKRLFDDNGEQTEHLKGVLNFLQDYQQRAAMTQSFCKMLKELDLLEPMQANIEFNEHADKNMSIKGFYAVKREKLKALSDEQLLDLFKKDGLELIYAHLQSLSNLNRLVEFKSAKLAS